MRFDAGASDPTITSGSGTLTFSNVTVADGNVVDLDAINNSTTTEGLLLPQGTAPTGGTAEGQIGWDTDNDSLGIGDGSRIIPFAPLSAEKTFRVYDEFLLGSLESGEFGALGWASVISGTGAVVTGEVAGSAGRLGILTLETGTTTTGRTAIEIGTPGFVTTAVLVEGGLVLETAVRINNLSDATDEYDLIFGLCDTFTANCVYGVYFQYDRNTSTEWLRSTAENSVRTETATRITVATGWNRFRIVVNSGATSIEFFINGTSAGSNTANIPTVGTTPHYHVI